MAYAISGASLEQVDGFLRQWRLVGTADWTASRIEGPVVSARSGERLIGIGRLYQSWLHPARWRVSLFVGPAHRRRGIGSALLDELVDRLATDDRELQASTSATDEARIAFLSHRRFEPLMTTRIGVLDPDRVPEPWWLRAHEADVELQGGGIRVVTLAERPELFAPAAEAHARVYRDQHAWNPPLDLTLEQANDLFLDPDELVPDRQYLALSGEEVAGIASLRDTGDPAVLDLGWIGTIGVPVERAYPVAMALFGRCMLDAARSRAVIALEIDEVDPAVNRIVDALPVDWDPSWLTYAR